MVKIVFSQENLNEFLCLVREYTNAVLSERNEVSKTLSSQYLEDELKHIEKNMHILWNYPCEKQNKSYIFFSQHPIGLILILLCHITSILILKLFF